MHDQAKAAEKYLVDSVRKFNSLTLPESPAPSAEIFTNQGYKYYIYTAVVASGQAREMCLLCPELTLFLVLC